MLKIPSPPKTPEKNILKEEDILEKDFEVLGAKLRKHLDPWLDPALLGLPIWHVNLGKNPALICLPLIQKSKICQLNKILQEQGIVTYIDILPIKIQLSPQYQYMNEAEKAKSPISKDIEPDNGYQLTLSKENAIILIKTPWKELIDKHSKEKLEPEKKTSLDKTKAKKRFLRTPLATQHKMPVILKRYLKEAIQEQVSEPKGLKNSSTSTSLPVKLPQLDERYYPKPLLQVNDPTLIFSSNFSLVVPRIAAIKSEAASLINDDARPEPKRERVPLSPSDAFQISKN